MIFYKFLNGPLPLLYCFIYVISRHFTKFVITTVSINLVFPNGRTDEPAVNYLLQLTTVSLALTSLLDWPELIPIMN